MVLETLTVQDAVKLAVVDRSGFIESRHAGAAVVLSPDGATAWVPQADLSYPAELVTVDLASGERIATVALCAGSAVLGDVAPIAADAGLVATGSCVDGDGPQATAFLVG